MNPRPYTISNVAKQMRDERSTERKSAERDKNQEIESIKRTLYNALDRLEKLKNR